MGSAGHLGVGNPPGCSDGFRSVGRSDLHTEAGCVSGDEVREVYRALIPHCRRSRRCSFNPFCLSIFGILLAS